MMLEAIRRRLIVSCQAPEGDAFRDSGCMARFAAAAVDGGAAAIRAAGTDDVRAIRAAVRVPILGIEKVVQADGRILITPSFEGARALVEAGADMVALDCTARGQRHGALDRLRQIAAELRVPVLADVATVQDAEAAVRAGAAAVLSTLRGYTDETAHIQAFEPGFIAALCRAVSVPVIAEGRVDTPELVRCAFEAGAWSVVTGAAITRPSEITRRFVSAIPRAESGWYAAIDLGGTNTKSGLVSADGELRCAGAEPTPAGGRDILLGHLEGVAKQCLADARSEGIALEGLGIATAGWVDPYRGRVAYATENLPGWTGTEIAATLGGVLGMQVAVENDANALALAEQVFGAGRGVDHFICLTLGTGVGGGCCIGGQLNRGAHFFANALGHVVVEPDGLPCTCGRSGCLEQYANAAALVRYAEDFADAGQVIEAANSGVPAAQNAIRRLALYLGRACATFLHVLDPELIVLSGGLAQNNPKLIEALREEIAAQTMVWQHRRVRLEASTLGYHGGVYGAAAIARHTMRR